MQSAGPQQRMPLAVAGLVVIGATPYVMYEMFPLVAKRSTPLAHRGSGSE
jgi:hypothetical protein